MRSLYLGRAFGIPLYIHWSFILLPLWVLFLSRGESTADIVFTQFVLLSLFGCVLLHELGHAMMARFFRIPTRDITLYPIGGVARLESTGRAPHQEVAIALAGPAVNLALVIALAPFFVVALVMAGVFGATDPTADKFELWPMAIRYLSTLCIGNGILMIFNLIPAFPMDGGRVLRALLTIPLGLVRATGVAAGVGMAVGICMAVAGATFLQQPTLILVSAFVVFAGQAEFQMLRRMEAARERERRLREEWPAVEMLVPAGDPLDPSVPMRPVGTVVPATSQGGFTGFLWDSQEKVWVRWVDGQREDVFDALRWTDLAETADDYG